MTKDHSKAPFPLPDSYLSKHLGFQTNLVEPGHTAVTIDIQPEHRNITGVVHGGLLMTVLDTLMGHAVYTHLGDPAARFGTSQMTTHFLRVVAKGTLTGEGHVVAQSEKYVMAEAEIRSEGGDLVATAEAQFTTMRRKLLEEVL
jgi:uncharacterized protein (TIGR00369 family)